ncbi:MAG: NlpC/P60 family protein [Bacteroidetes bacterium]|nr:MAG: NlpC/P60 family protein [Bacteroidota bacterium]
MQKTILILLLICCFTSCKSSKRVSDNSKKAETSSTKNVSFNKLANNIIKNAETYNGVRYKYGGTTNKGMDCSGLIYVAFKSEHIVLPRISRNMAKKGVHIKLNEVKKGDLLFFKTNKKGKGINHVGLVVTLKRGFIEFIHSTTSKGVIISSLLEPYWQSAFIEARRVL